MAFWGVYSDDSRLHETYALCHAVTCAGDFGGVEGKSSPVGYFDLVSDRLPLGSLPE